MGETPKLILPKLKEKFSDGSLDINARFENDATLLHKACWLGDFSIVEWLIANGANVKAKDCYGSTPLGAAVLRGHGNIAELLLNRGADPHSVIVTDCVFVRTVLSEAIFQDNLKMINLLKKYGGNINNRDKEGKTDLHRLAQYSEHNVEKLLKAGIDVNMLDSKNHTAFYYLPSSNQVDVKEIEKIVKLLIKYGASMHEPQSRALPAAVEKGDVAVAEILIQNGAMIELGSWGLDSMSPLNMASALGNFKMVQMLIKHGADVNTYDYWGITPLISAASCGNSPGIPPELNKESEYAKIVKGLIKEGAKVNVSSGNLAANFDETPLLCAARANNTEIVKILVDGGAKINVVNCFEETPRSLAKANKNKEMEDFLYEKQRGG
jgi:ankyrin repeat protein